MNKLNKIIHIIPTLGGGGAEILLGHISIEQVRRGKEVHIILLEDFHFTYKNYPFKKELEDNVQIHLVNDKISFSFVKRKFINHTKKIDELITKINPDIIHSHLYLSEIYSHIKHFKNVTYISHLHDNMFQFSLSKKLSLKNKLTDFIEVTWLKKQYKKFDNQFIAISKNTYDFFEKNLPKKSIKNIHILPNAININKFSPKKHTKSDVFKLINIGNMVPKKNHLMLIEVMYELKKRNNYKIHLSLLGFGPLESKIRKKITEYNLENEITLFGNVSNVSEFLSDSDLYIHSATYEPFGMVFIEAMASGLPIVSTNGKGNKDIIVDNLNGYLLKNFDVLDFANAIEKILSNNELKQSLSNNSVLKSKEYSIEKYVDKLDIIYSKMNQYQ